MSKRAKHLTVFVFLAAFIIYFLFVYVRQNERMSTCTRLYSQCVITGIKYLNLGGIDVQYYYWVGEKPVNVRWKESSVEAKNLIACIKLGDTLPLLYCKEYPALRRKAFVRFMF